MLLSITKTFLFVSLMVFSHLSEAFAIDDNSFAAAMCNLDSIVSGNMGKVLASLALISIGIGFFNGKVSWGLLIGVSAGIALMFSAPNLLSVLTGESVYDCSSAESYDVSAGNTIYSPCFIARENDPLVMTAPQGKVWTGVSFASFGLPSSCSLGACHAPNSVSIVAAACVGKSTCTVIGRNSVFGGDPCPGNPKMFHVKLTY
jgi:type IV secretory pathway VirB2 component (pilin)